TGASTMASRNTAGGTFSVLGADLVVTGDVAATADSHIDGRVKGDITCAASVQGEASVIEGAVKAQTARLSGTVHGAIEAGESVISRSAHIHGDVSYDASTIEQGAQVDGRFAPRAAPAGESTSTSVS
ncbi:hypothetical protein OY671_008213, partial [Metschnikowia pulcherrima]